MNSKYIIILFFAALSSSLAFGQVSEEETKRLWETQENYIRSVNSPRGNYIHNYGGYMKPIMSQVSYFLIKRSEVTSAGNNDKGKTKDFKVKPIKSTKELKEVFGDMSTSEYASSFGIEESKLVEHFKEWKEPSQYGVEYFLLETQMAAGHLFLDKEIESDKSYKYAVSWVDDKGNETLINTTIVGANEGNVTLKYITPETHAVRVADSSISFSWRMDVSENLNREILFTGIDDPQMDQKLRENYLSLSTSTLIANTYCFNGASFESESKIIGNALTTGDTIEFNYSREHLGKKLNACYAQIEDLYGNIGNVSDTAYGYAVTKRNLPIIFSIDVTEEEDAIRIGWDPLPNLPYIAGVLVYRFSGADGVDTVGIAHAGDTSIMDYNITVGETYRYKAKTLFSTGVQFEQENPAEATGQYTKFSAPDLPTNLRASSISNGIKLEWDHTSHQSTFGYFIYRGTKPNKVKLLTGPVKGLSFNDTAASLSGRSTYFYRVMAQNYRQDTSELSEYVSINPEKEIKLSIPENMEFYFENGKLHITWQDIRIYDNAIDGFILEKRIKGGGEGDYERIEEVIVSNTFVDTLVRAGDAFEYRVAALSYRGDEGDFSSPAVFDHTTSNNNFIEDFVVRNTIEGIYVSVPVLKSEDRVSLNIYRRTAKDKNFKKLVDLPPGKFDYADNAVEDGVLYVYAVAIINKEGKESKLSFSQSVRRSLK